MSARPAYPPLPAWKWPEPGVRTWTAPAESFFGACTGRDDCAVGAGCPVGLVVTVGAGRYGCDCSCHARPAVLRNLSPGGQFPPRA